MKETDKKSTSAKSNTFLRQQHIKQFEKNKNYYSKLGIDPLYHESINIFIFQNLSYIFCLSKVEFDSGYSPVIFDVGCSVDYILDQNFEDAVNNLDDFTLLCLSKFGQPKIYGVEPLHWSTYQKQYEDDSRITLIKKALGDKSEKKTLKVPIFKNKEGKTCINQGGSSFWDRRIFDNQNITGTDLICCGYEPHEVDCITLDDLVDEYNLKVIDYLKLDTEGSEYIILNGAEKSLINKKIKYIQLEYGECLEDSKTSVEDIVDYLSKFNYEIIFITGSEILFACKDDLGCSKIVDIPLQIDFHSPSFSLMSIQWPLGKVSQFKVQPDNSESIIKVPDHLLGKLNGMIDAIPVNCMLYWNVLPITYQKPSKKITNNEYIKVTGSMKYTMETMGEENKEYFDRVNKFTESQYNSLGIEPEFHDYINKMKSGVYEDVRVINQGTKMDFNKLKDNIFPEGAPGYLSYQIDNFSTDISLNTVFDGDILEFGVASCQSIINIASKNPDRKVFGFDHFKGLEKTNKNIPKKSGWEEGAFRLGDPNYFHIPDTIDAIYRRIAPYTNINLIVEDIHNLSNPSDYGIGKIAAVNIDVDIYEPTVSALNFVDKCEWDRLHIRFDDWHGCEPEYDQHERLACREWLYKNNYHYVVCANGPEGGIIVWRQRVDEGEIEKVLAETLMTISYPKYTHD
jgi:FkbM family methyltransferase